MQLNPMPTAGHETAPPVKDKKGAEKQYDSAYEYYFIGDWLAAEEYVRRAVQVDEQEPRYHLLAAQVYCARGWLSMAQSELHTLKELDPHNPSGKSLEQLLKSKMAVKTQKNSGNNQQTAGWRAALERAVSWMN